jgi:shikimate dehydrogenase
MTGGLTGRAMVAGVVGHPVAHSLSPRLHGAWIAAVGLDAAYVPFAPAETGFRVLVEGFRGGVVRGLNVTLPFKEEALRLTDRADAASKAAGAANLLLFHPDQSIEARNTDGIGLLAAFAEQAPDVDLTAGPVVVLGAGGAARGAVAALASAGAQELRIVNRSVDRASALADAFGGRAYSLGQAAQAFDGATAIINSTSAGLGDNPAVLWPLEAAPRSTAVMDMVYKPLNTRLLDLARQRGMPTVDGLAMLIGQARPSFEAFYGQPPPEEVDVRALLLEAMG